MGYVFPDRHGGCGEDPAIRPGGEEQYMVTDCVTEEDPEMSAGNLQHRAKEVLIGRGIVFSVSPSTVWTIPVVTS